MNPEELKASYYCRVEGSKDNAMVVKASSPAQARRLYADKLGLHPDQVIIATRPHHAFAYMHRTKLLGE